MVKEYTRGAQIRYKLTRTDRLHLQFIRQRLIAEHGMVCALCGKPIESKDELTVDHIIPRAMGGATIYENCQLAHKICNLRKGDKYIGVGIAENHNEISKNSIDKS